MAGARYIEGFSRLDPKEKVEIISRLSGRTDKIIKLFEEHKHPDTKLRKLYRDFSENNLTDFHLPFGICHNQKLSI